MFAEERKVGTEQLLFTSPISITKIVLGKPNFSADGIYIDWLFVVVLNISDCKIDMGFLSRSHFFDGIYIGIQTVQGCENIMKLLGNIHVFPCVIINRLFFGQKIKNIHKAV